MPSGRRIVFFVTEDWYFYSHRLPLAQAALDNAYDVHLVTRVTKRSATTAPEGLTVHDIDVRRGSLNPFNDIRLLVHLVVLLRRLRPDILHNVALKPTIYGSIAAALGSRRTQVVNALGGLGFVFSSTGPRTAWLRRLVLAQLRIALSGARRSLILQNEDDAQLLVKHRIVRRSAITLIRGSGVDPNVFVPHEHEDRIPVVALTARLLRDKGIHEFVQAVTILRERGVEARFVLIGAPDPDNPSSVTEEQCLSWQNSPGVEFWGWNSTMSLTLSEVDIVVLPSYREGLPKSLLEAASCALPIVTCDTSGCRDVVIDGYNGYLVPVGSVQPIADALDGLLKSPDTRVAMGLRGRALVLEKFSLTMVVEQTLSLYRKVLST